MENELQNQWKIILPEDPLLAARLGLKLQEYTSRISPVKPYGAQMDSILKKDVLKRLLEKKEVVVLKLADELRVRYGDLFNIDTFFNAAHVVQAYVNGSSNIRGGTLPNLKRG